MGLFLILKRLLARHKAFNIVYGALIEMGSVVKGFGIEFWQIVQHMSPLFLYKNAQRIYPLLDTPSTRHNCIALYFQYLSVSMCNTHDG